MKDVRNRNSWYQRRATAAVGQVLPLHMATTWPNRQSVSQCLDSAPIQWFVRGRTLSSEGISLLAQTPRTALACQCEKSKGTSQLCKICCYTHSTPTQSQVSWLHGSKPRKPPLSEYCEWWCLKPPTLQWRDKHNQEALRASWMVWFWTRRP